MGRLTLLFPLRDVIFPLGDVIFPLGDVIFAQGEYNLSLGELYSPRGNINAKKPLKTLITIMERALVPSYNWDGALFCGKSAKLNKEWIGFI
ncbi:MAG: hypothetical protein ACQEXB_09530 [Bacillota bacterium]